MLLWRLLRGRKICFRFCSSLEQRMGLWKLEGKFALPFIKSLVLIAEYYDVLFYFSFPNYNLSNNYENYQLNHICLY